MQINTVPMSRGLDWITEGFALFRLNPFTWIIIQVIFFVIILLVSLVPVVGAIGALLLQPIMIGGLLLGCRALEQGGELRVDHLFDGFRQYTQPLVMVGLISFVGYLVVGLVVFLVAASLIDLGNLQDYVDRPELAMGGATIGFLFTGLVGLALSVPIAMATWFAPALIVFDHIPAWEAIKSSFLACLNNMMPFLYYGIVILVLATLAMIPFGLGMLVLGPTLFASVYTGYRDIFKTT